MAIPMLSRSVRVRKKKRDQLRTISCYWISVFGKNGTRPTKGSGCVIVLGAEVLAFRYCHFLGASFRPLLGKGMVELNLYWVVSSFAARILGRDRGCHN